MAGTLFSPSWYRVAGLKPRLRTHVDIHRHSYRGTIWFVLQDHSSGRSHRLTPAAYAFIGLMDETRTVQNIWDLCNERGGRDAPTQDDVVRLLGQLHAADALICDVPPDTRELFRRFQRQRRQTWRQRLWTPLAIRVPLFDPDAFLERTAFLVRPLFGRLGALIWLAVVTAGLVLAGLNWSTLTEDVVDRVLAPQNLVLLWFVYPLVKAIHELGHAYATKIYGGEVHEIGVMFLVFVPVPYVDASAASSFPDKRQRMAVGAIGIGVEMLLAAVAVFVFAHATIGLVHAIAYNVILIGGVSTILFNGNPLLRFDGYYVLTDALELPNSVPTCEPLFGLPHRALCLWFARGELSGDGPARAHVVRVLWHRVLRLPPVYFHRDYHLAWVTLFHHRRAPSDMVRCQSIDYSRG